jgi:hypothetical protein
MLISLGIFLIFLILEVISKYRLSKLKTLGSFIMIYDIAFITIMGILTYMNFKSQNKNSDYYNSYFKRDFNITLTNYQNANNYIDLTEMLDLDDYRRMVGAITISMLGLRVLFYISASPIIKFMVNLFFTVAIRIFNIFVILVIFIFSFSLIFHTIIGKRVDQWSNITNSIIITLVSILGALSSKTFSNLTIPQSTIIICFLIFIKFILFTFVFAINKESYKDLRKQFNHYKKVEHFKIIGETVFLYMKYMLPGLNLIFIVKDLFYYKRLFGSTDYKRLIDDNELKGKIKLK